MIRERILKIYDEQEALEEELKTLLKKYQAECSHPSVVQGDAYGDPRICIVCGLEEAYTYKLLQKSIVVRKLPTWYKYRQLHKLTTVVYPADE